MTPIRVAISIGHRGPGTGAAHEGYDEHTLAHKAAVAIGFHLMTYADRGVTSLYQPFLIGAMPVGGLEEKAVAVLDVEPHVVLCCHFNAFPDVAAHGCEMLVHEDADDSTRFLAHALNAGITGELDFRNRGVTERDNLYMLNQLGKFAPTVILEPGFITNEHDRAVMQGDLFWVKLGAGVSAALEEWRMTYL